MRTIDQEGFDRLARTVSGGTDRRRLLAGLLGAVLAGSLGGATADAKRKRQRHKRRVKAQKGGNASGNSPNAKRCQKGGWATLARAGDAAVPFTSENECVRYGAQGGQLAVVNPCHGQPDGTTCGGGVCCGEQCQAGSCCPENNAGCTGGRVCTGNRLCVVGCDVSEQKCGCGACFRNLSWWANGHLRRFSLFLLPGELRCL